MSNGTWMLSQRRQLNVYSVQPKGILCKGMRGSSVPDAVETGELFQKDVDDGSWGSEGKGQGDKGDGSSSDGDTDDDGDSCRAAREAKPRPGTTYASQISTVNLPTYPTGDDALAWNDCLQDFFKTDEDTARSIQKSWPSNLLVKHLIRDRFFHSYLCEYWRKRKSFPATLAAFVEFVTEMSAKQFSSQHDQSHEKLTAALGNHDFMAEICFAKNDREINVETIQKYFQFGQPLMKITVRSETFTAGTLGNLSKSLLFTPNVTDIVIWFKEVNSEDTKQAMVVLSCMHNLKHVQVNEYGYVSRLSGMCSTFTLKCKTRPNVWSALASCQKLKKMKVSYNKLSDRGDFLPSLPNLEEIDLSHHAISDEAVPGLAESLGSCQNLKKVNLSYNKLSDRGDFLPPLPNLKEIDLSNNAISDETVPGLAEGLGSCQNLKKVNLSYNKLHNRGDFLPPLPNLEEIGLSWNAISDVAMPGLTEGLGSCQNLKKVNLSHNKLSGRGDFLPPLPNLEKIDLSWNAISDVAVPGLTEGLGSCQNLKKVNLSGNKLSDRGDFLTPLPNLEEIDLGHNNISDVAVPGLAEGLGSCQKLKKVVLHFNKLADVGELMNAFINLPILTQVDIQYNSIRDESLPAIAAWLKVSTAVEKVRLEYNRFSAEGVRDFVRTMKGKAYSDGCFSDILLYDGSLADVGEAVQAGGEGARREEQQWGRLRSWLRLIKVKVGQLTVLISHEGTRS
ncbi:PREDICTED: uncharacterized protein LOC109473243 [Branchiostoma belcheri]|uniref:Uncharacterized protein LOC109473243 n=1 Tax=Branchiostoma belcheri TaxID=7741 RepID=A0A6P4YWG2_BRABE|nr:PREDICTED: uncharacterized protein LOC109473243 [Branchiostoma belcheri]